MAAAVAGGGVVSMVKFRPPLGVDSILKGAFSVRINTRHMCITAMDAYDNSSLEELRLAHYDRLRSFIGIPPAPRFSTPQNAWANPGGTDQQGHASPRNPFSVIGNPGRNFINAARRLRKEHTKTHHDNKQQGTCTKATNTMVTTDSLLSERMDVIEQRVAHLEVTSRSGGEADRPASNHVTTKCTPEPKRDAKCELGDGISDKMIGQSGTLLLFKNENRLHQYMGQRNIKLANVHVFFSDKTRTVALMVNPNNATWNSSANMLPNGIRREKWRTAGSSASSSAPPMEGMADLNVDVTRPKSHHSTWSTSPSRREPSKGEGISKASSSAYARREQWTVGEGSTPGSGVQGDGAPRGEDRRPIWTEEDTRFGTSASAESSDDDAEADDYFGPLLRAAEELRDSVRGRDVFALGQGTDRRLDILSRWAASVSGSPVTHVPVPAKVTNFEVTNAEVTRAKGTNAKMTDCTEINNKTMDEKVTKSDAMVTVQEQRDSFRSRGIVSTEPSVNRRLQIHGRLADLISGSSITHVEASKSDLVSIEMLPPEVTNAEVANAKVTNAKVTNAEVTNAEVTNTEVANTEVTITEVTKAEVTKTEVTYAHVINAELTNAEGTNTEVTNAKMLYGKETDHTTTDDKVTDDKVTDDKVTEIANTEVTNTEVTKAEVTKTEVTNAHVINAELTNAEGTNTEVTNAKMLWGRTAGDRSHTTDDKVTDDKVTEIANTEVTNTEVTNTEVTKAEVAKTEVTNSHVINAELTNAEGTNAEVTNAKMLWGRTAGDRSHTTDDKVTDDKVTDDKETNDKVTET